MSTALVSHTAVNRSWWTLTGGRRMVLGPTTPLSVAIRFTIRTQASRVREFWNRFFLWNFGIGIGRVPRNDHLHSPGGSTIIGRYLRSLIISSSSYCKVYVLDLRKLCFLYKESSHSVSVHNVFYDVFACLYEFSRLCSAYSVCRHSQRHFKTSVWNAFHVFIS